MTQATSYWILQVTTWEIFTRFSDSNSINDNLWSDGICNLFSDITSHISQSINFVSTRFLDLCSFFVLLSFKPWLRGHGKNLEAKSIILHFVNASNLTLNSSQSIIQFRWQRQLLTIKQKEDSSNNFKITDKSIKSYNAVRCILLLFIVIQM